MVLACTSGTAAAHFHAAVIEADEAGVPLIVLTADRPPELREVGAGQTIDQLKLYGDAAKWFFDVGLHEASAIHTFLHQRASDLNRAIKLRIQVGSFEAACRMIEAKVGIGILPESAALRYRKTMAIRLVQLKDDWALRHLHVCMRSLELLPAFARDLVDLLRADADE